MRIDRINPLRYPGSKVQMFNFLKSFFEKNYLNTSHIIEPFAGSAAASILLVMHGYASRATLIEKDPLLYSFWHTVFSNPERLIEQINRVNVDLETWRYLHASHIISEDRNLDVSESAFAALFLNRTSFSGIIGAGPIGGFAQSSKYKIDCRFNKNNLIERIYNLSKIGHRFRVVYGDGIEYIENTAGYMEKGVFLYMDPPYIKNGKKYYRNFFDETEHWRLGRAILNMNPNVAWGLSYDMDSLVTSIYGDHYPVYDLNFFYSARVSKAVKEYFVTNQKMPGEPEEQEKFAGLLPIAAE